MRAPEFWQRSGLIPTLLSPFSLIWRTAAYIRAATTTRWTAPVPVLCVGNLTVGGSGKTPVALSLAEALIAAGHTPHFLSRGYGGSEKGPLKIDTSLHTAVLVGDEPLLLARLAPTWVGRDRQATAQAAVDSGADCLIMDDGFQNPLITKTRSVLVIDGGYGFGNGKVIPAGPLRETVQSGAARANAAVVIGDNPQKIAERIAPMPTFNARFEPRDFDELADQTVFAFAGIGRPTKFYETLHGIGCTIAETQDFDDHHLFTPEDIMDICDRATALKAIPVTTEKDFVRLPVEAQAMVKQLPVRLVWEQGSAPVKIVTDLFSNG